MMKTLLGFLICLLLSPGLYAGDSEDNDLIGPPPSDLKVLERLLDDQQVVLKGEWTDRQKNELRWGVEKAIFSRKTRFAESADMTMRRSTRFEIGGQFRFVEERDFKQKTRGAIWGGEISGTVRTRYSIPSNATSDEIALFLDGKLPVRLLHGERRLASLRSKITEAQQSKICQYLLGWIR